MQVKQVEILEHLAFISLGVLSIVFADERLLADSSYYFIRVINTGSFWVEHSRLILILPELAPLIGSLVKLDLKSLVLTYSVGHVAFFYLIFLLSRYRYENRAAGPILLLIQTLGIRAGFFVPMFELYYAAGLMVLLMSILKRDRLTLKSYTLIAVLTILVTSAHMFAIMLLVFLFAWQTIDTGFKHWKVFALGFGCISAFSVYKHFNISEYEKGKMDAFIDGLKHYSPDLTYLENLATFLIDYYLVLILLAALSFGILFWQKKYWRLLLYSTSFTGLLIMVTIAYRGFEPSRYQEQVYFPLSFIVAWTLVVSSDSISSNRVKTALFTTGLVVFAIRTLGITQEAKWFTNRQNELRSLITQTQEKAGTKFFIHESVLKHDPNWSFPIESLILSSIEYDKTVTICSSIDIEHGDNLSILKPNQFLFRRWELYDRSVLNPAYFRLDTSDYQRLEKPTH